MEKMALEIGAPPEISHNGRSVAHVTIASSPSARRRLLFSPPASDMSGTFRTFVYDKLRDRRPRPTSSLHLFLLPYLFPPSSQGLGPRLQVKEPAAEDCERPVDVVQFPPWEWEPQRAQRGGVQQRLETEWAEQPQEKPQRTFVCHGQCFSVSPPSCGSTCRLLQKQ